MEKISALEEFERTIQDVLRPGWYGTVSCDVKDGKIILIRKERAILPQERLQENLHASRNQ
jgi:hypothetical protein